jgi:hypothetical protein
MKKIFLLLLLCCGLYPAFRGGKLTPGLGSTLYAQSFGDEDSGEDDGNEDWGDPDYDYDFDGDGDEDVYDIVNEIIDNGIENFNDGYTNFEFGDDGVMIDSDYFTWDEINENPELLSDEFYDFAAWIREDGDEGGEPYPGMGNWDPNDDGGDDGNTDNSNDVYLIQDRDMYGTNGLVKTIFVWVTNHEGPADYTILVWQDGHKSIGPDSGTPPEGMTDPLNPQLPGDDDNGSDTGNGSDPGTGTDDGIPDDIDWSEPDFNHMPEEPYDLNNDDWFYWFYGMDGTYSNDPTTPPTPFNPMPVPEEDPGIDLDAEYSGIRNYVTPAGTPIVLPPGSKIRILKNLDNDYFPNGALYDFVLPDGSRYVAVLAMVGGGLTMSDPTFKGYYKVVNGAVDMNQPYTGSNTPTPEPNGDTKIIRLTKVKNADGTCSLVIEVVNYKPGSGVPATVNGTETQVDDGIIFSGKTPGIATSTAAIDCPTVNLQPQGNNWDLEKYVKARAIQLKQFLKGSINNSTKIYLFDCNTNKVLYTVTGDAITPVSGADQDLLAQNFAAGNFGPNGEKIAIKACIQNNNNWNYEVKLNIPANEVDPRVAPVLQQIKDEIKRQADDEVKNIKAPGAMNRGESVDAGNGERFSKADMDLLQALTAIYDVGTTIIKEGQMPETIWDRGVRSGPADAEAQKKYNKSPFNMPAAVGGVGDQLIDEATGALQLAKTALQFVREPKKTFQGIWNGVKSLNKDKIGKIFLSLTGADNYMAGGDRGVYQGGKHGVQLAMIVVSGLKNVAEGTDVVKKSGDEISEIEKFVPDGNTNQEVTDALKNATDNKQLFTNVDNEKLITKNVENGEDLVVVAEKNATNVELYKVKESELVDARSGTQYTMDDIVDGAKEVEKPKTVNVVNGKNQIETDAGAKGGWNKDLNKPEPNSEYVVKNSNPATSHTYTTDGEGRVTKVEATLSTATRDRNGYQQSVKCNKSKDGIPGDQGGHLVGSRFDGAGEQINLVPMNSTLNLGDWKSMENGWANEISLGKEVKIEITPIYSGTSKRPVKFEVEYYIDGNYNFREFNN